MKFLFYSASMGRTVRSGGILCLPDRFMPFVKQFGLQNVEKIDNLTLELADGEYRDFLPCDCFRLAVSLCMKELFERYGVDPEVLEFIPVPVISEEYGDRTYYLLHFKQECDVQSQKMTQRLAKHGDYPWRLVLDYNKINKGWGVFNTRSYGMRIIITDEVRRAINREKMHRGIHLEPVECTNVPEELQEKGYHNAVAWPWWKRFFFPYWV